MNVQALLDLSRTYLKERGVPDPAANAQFLMGAMLGCGRVEVELRRLQPVSSSAQRRYWRRVKLLGRRIPLAYVLGTQPFCGMDLKVSPRVLIPRPETEELALLAADIARRLRDQRKRRLSILDFGTGSGCLALFLKRELPEVEVVALDVSSKALRVAKNNAKALGLSKGIRFLRGGALGARWRADLIVSNPPYIPTARLRGLAPEVLQEPRLALDGGPDGLKVINELIALAGSRLSPGGFLLLEMDSSQGLRIREALRARGFRKIQVISDAQGLDRFISSEWGGVDIPLK